MILDLISQVEFSDFNGGEIKLIQYTQYYIILQQE